MFQDQTTAPICLPAHQAPQEKATPIRTLGSIYCSPWSLGTEQPWASSAPQPWAREEEVILVNYSDRRSPEASSPAVCLPVSRVH